MPANSIEVSLRSVTRAYRAQSGDTNTENWYSASVRETPENPRSGLMSHPAPIAYSGSWWISIRREQLVFCDESETGSRRLSPSDGFAKRNPPLTRAGRNTLRCCAGSHH
jgi:hypothetical protein